MEAVWFKLSHRSADQWSLPPLTFMPISHKNNSTPLVVIVMQIALAHFSLLVHIDNAANITDLLHGFLQYER
jgi:hypothetical protein